MIFQKNFWNNNSKPDLFFLATDFAVSEKHRSLKLVLDFWEKGKSYLEKNFPQVPIIHSSNKKSEPIYRTYFSKEQKSIVKPTFFWPKLGYNQKNEGIGDLLYSNHGEYREWRWSRSSKRNYIKVFNVNSKKEAIVGVIRKAFGIRILIILEFDVNYFAKKRFIAIYQLIKLCITNFTIFPVFYLNKNSGTRYFDSRKHFKNFPKLVSLHQFPIYIHNYEKIVDKEFFIKLSLLDVL